MADSPRVSVTIARTSCLASLTPPWILPPVTALIESLITELERPHVVSVQVMNHILGTYGIGCEAGGAKPFFNERVQDLDGGGRDQRRQDNSRITAKENERALLVRLQQVLAG